MSDNPVPRAAALLDHAHEQSFERAGGDLASPWAMLATRAALVSSLLATSAGDVAAPTAGSVSDDLRHALRLLTEPGASDALPINDLLTARRWLSEVVLEADELAP